jgi:hypothetical protein
MKVAGVLKLTQHLGVGDDLGLEGRGQGKEMAQQRGLAYPWPYRFYSID